MNKFKRIGLVAVMVMALGAGFGCAKKQVTNSEDQATSGNEYSANAAAIDQAAQTISDGIVYFDFDKFDIQPEYRDLLQQKADLMKAPAARRNTTSPLANAAPAPSTNTWSCSA